MPTFAALRDQLPAPIYDEKPVWIQMYWKAWELAFRNFHEPAPGSGYVSQFIDAAFNQNIFLWDTCFLTMFCNYAHPLVPGIGSLDNFYAKQYDDGEICREIDRQRARTSPSGSTGKAKPLFSRWGWNGTRNDPVVYRAATPPQPPPRLTLDALNHPIFAWAELESFRVTGDRTRLALVYEPLVRYYRALQKYIRQGNGLYMTDWASMDNSPRNAFLPERRRGVDTSIADGAVRAPAGRRWPTLLGKNRRSRALCPARRDELGRAHQRARCGIRERQFLLRPDRRRQASAGQDDRRVLDAAGGRGRAGAGRRPGGGTAQPARPSAGSIASRRWRPTSRATIRPAATGAARSGRRPTRWSSAAWRRYGHADLAREIALEHWTVHGEVFAEDRHDLGELRAGRRRAGQAGQGAISSAGAASARSCILLEYAIGLKPDALRNELVWDLRRASASAASATGSTATSSTCSPRRTTNGNGWEVTIRSDGAFTLRLKTQGREKRCLVPQGESRNAGESRPRPPYEPPLSHRGSPQCRR